MANAILNVDTARLADEIESWLQQITPAATPLPALPVPTEQGTEEATFGGWTIAALTTAGMAEVHRSEQAATAARIAARPGWLKRLTRRHHRPVATASAHIRQAAALLVSGGWCRDALRSADGRHCILGALRDIRCEADTMLRAHAYIRGAMSDPAPYERPTSEFEAEFTRRCRAAGADLATERRALEISQRNDIAAPTLGAVLELLDRAALAAAHAGD